MTDARERILERLRGNRPAPVSTPNAHTKPRAWNRDQRIARFTAGMQGVRGEVHRVGRDRWVEWLNTELPSRGLVRGLIGNSAIGREFAGKAAAGFVLKAYDRPIEEWKDELFRDIDFALTGTLAGLAETGSLVLWPDAAEPRLMSLVPPVHVAILDGDRLFDNFAHLVAAENWAADMPTNALLISGPSKTADIEQTLAYGIHGPRSLITLITG